MLRMSRMLRRRLLSRAGTEVVRLKLALAARACEVLGAGLLPRLQAAGATLPCTKLQLL